VVSPRWSPDGRYIAAITDDSLKLVLFDRLNQQWQDLVSLPIGYPSWAHDGQYIYFDTTLSEDAAFFRVRISDHKLERLISLKGLRRFWGQLGSGQVWRRMILFCWCATQAARKSTRSIGKHREPATSIVVRGDCEESGKRDSFGGKTQGGVSVAKPAKFTG
jgi:hypothetical protein